jgi:ammonia channel protein AmtB
MRKMKNKAFKSRIPAASWDQVWFLGAIGVGQLLTTFLMSLYSAVIEAKGSVNSTFDQVFQSIYAVMLFATIIGVSAVLLATVKAIIILRRQAQSKFKGQSK